MSSNDLRPGYELTWVLIPREGSAPVALDAEEVRARPRFWEDLTLAEQREAEIQYASGKHPQHFSERCYGFAVRMRLRSLPDALASTKLLLAVQETHRYKDGSVDIFAFTDLRHVDVVPMIAGITSDPSAQVAVSSDAIYAQEGTQQRYDLTFIAGDRIVLA